MSLSNIVSGDSRLSRKTALLSIFALAMLLFSVFCSFALTDLIPSNNIDLRARNISNVTKICYADGTCSTTATGGGGGGGGGSFDLWRLQISGQGINSIINNTLVRLLGVGLTISNDTNKNFTFTVDQGFNQSSAVSDLQQANVSLNSKVSTLQNGSSNLTLANILANGFLNLSSGVWTTNISNFNTSIGNLNTRASNLETANQTTNTSVTNLIARVGALNTSIGNSSVTRVFPLTSSFRLIGGRNTSVECVNDTSNNVNCTIQSIDTDTNSGGNMSTFTLNVSNTNSTQILNASTLYVLNSSGIEASLIGNNLSLRANCVAITGSAALCDGDDNAGAGAYDWNFTNGSSTGVITDSGVMTFQAGRNMSIINCTGTTCTFNAVDTDTNSGFTQWRLQVSGQGINTISNNTLVRLLPGTGISISNDTTNNYTITNTVVDTVGNLTVGNATNTYVVLTGKSLKFIAGKNISSISIDNDTSGNLNITINAIDTTGAGSGGGNFSYFFINNTNNQTQVSNTSKLRFINGAATFVVVQNDSLNTNITIDHADTSSLASVDNSGPICIQDITVDTYGHLTGVTSATPNTSIGNSSVSRNYLLSSTFRIIGGRNATVDCVNDTSNNVNCTINAIDTTSAGGGTNSLPATNISAGLFGSAVGSNDKYSFPSNLSINGTLVAGLNASAAGAGATAIGDNANATADQAIAIGQETMANRTHNIAIGYQAQATGNFDVVAIGTSAQADANDAVAIGTTAKELSQAGQGVAIGNGARIESSSSVAIGQNALVDNILWPDIDIDHSVAVGADSLSRGQYSTAIGPYAEAVGNQSTAIGYFARTRYDNSVALGENAITTSANQFVIGASGTNLNTKIFGWLNITKLYVNTSTTANLQANSSCTLIYSPGGGSRLEVCD